METTNESAELLRQAHPSEMCIWTHVNTHWHHTPGAAVAPEDLLVPSYWVQVGNGATLPEVGHLRPGDYIECRPADYGWLVELLVRDIGPEGVIMKVKHSAVFADRISPPGASKRAADVEASFHWAGPLLKWQVLAKDGRVLKSGCETEDQAAAWLAEHRKMQQRTTKGPK